MHVEDDDGSNDASDLVENLKIIIIGWKSSHDHGPLKTIKALEYVLMAEKLTGGGDAIAPLHVMSWKAFFNPPCLPALNECTIDINHMIYFLIFTLLLAQAIASITDLLIWWS